jgi:hypothetical protein
MAFTFYPAVAIFAVMVNMGLGIFTSPCLSYHPQELKNQTPQQKNHTLHRKA